ncbi:MAG: cytochrome c biogenesis protein CcdA [Lachnospiraceae bacterium]|nr:cytochrome c biogenesis protein CcdA [Lachnospiraceae bacterium]
MQYFISFLEGIITFISPCLLPMLPIYLSYFAGGGERSVCKTVKNALGFVAGFTLVFIVMGALAATLGSFFSRYQTAVNLVTGLIVVFFGLNFLGVFRVRLFRGSVKGDRLKSPGFFSSVLFGVIFSLGWTPCIGTFLGSALLLASQQEHAAAGIVMLLLYSLGLGVPFLISAVLIDKLKTAFAFVKRHYAVVNTVCGCFLVLVGILMMAGILGGFLTSLS